MTKMVNYRDSIKKQEELILLHYTSSIYMPHTRTTALPVHKKKLVLKKTIKNATKESIDESSKQTKKRGVNADFIVED